MDDRATLMIAAEFMSALGEHILEANLADGSVTFAHQRINDACESAERMLNGGTRAEIESEISADWPLAYRVTVTVERRPYQGKGVA